MNKLEERIIKFIKKHHVLTLATFANNATWCANCFYTYDAESNSLIFTSDDQTQHAREASIHPFVSGSIVLETQIVGKIQGIQFKGLMNKPKGDEKKMLEKMYLKRFPYAILMKTNIWKLEMTYIKMTDNQLGFGKKLIWQKA